MMASPSTISKPLLVLRSCAEAVVAVGGRGEVLEDEDGADVQLGTVPSLMDYEELGTRKKNKTGGKTTTVKRLHPVRRAV